MSLLLDTHAFLWFVSGDKKLPTSIKRQIEDVNNSCFVSIASFWEITIKVQLGKLKLGIPLKDLFSFSLKNEIEIIPISIDHLVYLSKLTTFHNDPFDRLIISQAIAENLSIATADEAFAKYDIDIVWK